MTRHLFLSTLYFFMLLSCGSLFAQYTPEEILKVLPSQKGVSVDVPAEADVASCKIIEFTEGKYRGVCLTKADGRTPLRVWCAPEGSNKVEQVRFYKNGNEVFRDLFDKDNPSCRWLSDNGTRWALLDSEKKVIAWKSISPEEATAEMVQALATGNLDRFKKVAVSEEEIRALGLTEPYLSGVLERIKSIDADFSKTVTALKLPPGIQWGAFNGNHPAIIPEGTRGLKEDLPIYYNAGVVLLNKENPNQNAQLFLGDLVRINGVWKILGLPSGDAFGASESENREIRVTSVFFPIQSDGLGAVGEVTGDYSRLAEQLNESYKKLETASEAEYPALCERTFSLLLNLAARNPKEEAGLVMQASDLLFTAIQRGLYPKGVEKLNQLCDTYKDNSNLELTAHLKLRQIEGTFYARTQTNPPLKRAELEKEQNKHSEELVVFAEKFSKTAAGISTLMFLAQDFEYLQEDEKAIQYYGTVVKNAGNTINAQKAAGAIKRIESVGKTLPLPAWNYLEGGSVDVTAMAGKPVAVFCWGAWIPEEVEQLKSCMKKFTDLNVIGINMDSNKADAESAIKTLAVPWKNVYENGGLEGAAAVALGIQNVPLIILYDKEGKVVRPNIQSVSELEVLLK